MAQQLNNSVARAFDILRLLGRGRPRIGVADVTRELGLNAITAHRFLKTLEAEGALVQVAKGSYRLGYALVDLGDRARDEDRLGQWLQPMLDDLTADLGEASMATIYQAGMVVCIARAMPPRSLSVDIRVGDRLEAYCTAHGKLWLAHVSPSERSRYLKSTPLDALTGRTITHRAQLEDEIAAIGARGHSYNLGEREDGITAVAVPVKTDGGRMVAGLSMFGPSSRIDRAALDRALVRLDAAAREAALLLYGRRLV
ncbi:IclR family transcriptional regulator [Devosia sediminis]|uniref:IclR family transcriptional regulator n=1 Tax=Devosia sediminis TaxID=2798801 RepID=A0A934MMD4_9HYPH|nr:IclR family transcriptional regulator [Devosia sediminis]MBJ3786090.1 IclR family transcriptional regulator [Devosia sediminis]